MEPAVDLGQQHRSRGDGPGAVERGESRDGELVVRDGTAQRDHRGISGAEPLVVWFDRPGAKLLAGRPRLIGGFYNLGWAAHLSGQ